jgi:GxxExxY protein
MWERDLTGKVIGAAMEVHRALGPGLLESAYHDCLKRELDLRGIVYESEVPIPVAYKGCLGGEAYRADLLVEHRLVVELKAADRLLKLHKAQLLTYLRLLDLKLGLLVNFNSVLLKDGISRVANRL